MRVGDLAHRTHRRHRGEGPGGIVRGGSATAPMRVPTRRACGLSPREPVRIGYAALTWQRGHAHHGEPEQRRLRGVAHPLGRGGDRAADRPQQRVQERLASGTGDDCDGSVATSRGGPSIRRLRAGRRCRRQARTTRGPARDSASTRLGCTGRPASPNPSGSTGARPRALGLLRSPGWRRRWRRQSRGPSRAGLPRSATWGPCTAHRATISARLPHGAHGPRRLPPRARRRMKPRQQPRRPPWPVHVLRFSRSRC